MLKTITFLLRYGQIFCSAALIFFSHTIVSNASSICDGSTLSSDQEEARVILTKNYGCKWRLFSERDYCDIPNMGGTIILRRCDGFELNAVEITTTLNSRIDPNHKRLISSIRYFFTEIF